MQHPRFIKSLAVIGAAALAVGLVGLVVLFSMIRQGFSARTSGSGLEERMALGLRKLAMPDRYETLKNPVVTDEKIMLEAMAHWADHCASCHANDGSGKTSMGENMYPRPPDMRAARTQQMTDGELYYVINQGIRFSGMPAWGRPGEDDRSSWELVAFIRKLPGLTADQIAAMKDMNPVPASAVKTKQEEDDFLNEEQPSDHKKH